MVLGGRGAGQGDRGTDCLTCLPSGYLHGAAESLRKQRKQGLFLKSQRRTNKDFLLQIKFQQDAWLCSFSTAEGMAMGSGHSNSSDAIGDVM